MPSQQIATTTYADTAASTALTSAQGYADSVLAGQTGANTSALLRRNPIPRISFTPLPGGVGTFDAGHGWTVTGPVTEAVDDTSVYRSGSQSLRVRSTTASGLIQITKSGLTAIDMSTRHGQGTVRVSDMTQISSIELRMGSAGASSFTNSTRWPSWLNATVTRPTLNNEWTTLAWTGDGESLTGSINMAAVINWELRITLASTATDVTVWIDQVGTRPQPLSSILPNGFVVWTMDDSFDDQISIGGRELDRFGMPAVMYHIISEVVGATAGHCTVAQVKDRLALGWEHGYHAWDQTEHVNRATSLSADAFDANFRQGISVLRSWGSASEAYCYPGGDFNATTIPVARLYASTQRTTSNEPKRVVWPFANELLTTYSAGAGIFSTDVTNAKLRVDAAKARKQGVIFETHHFVEAGDTGGYPADNFRTVLQYIADQGVAVLTFEDLWRLAS